MLTATTAHVWCMAQKDVREGKLFKQTQRNRVLPFLVKGGLNPSMSEPEEAESLHGQHSSSVAWWLSGHHMCSLLP